MPERDIDPGPKPGHQIDPELKPSRLPKRAHYDRATIDAILDDAIVCHVGFVRDGKPIVIPNTFARVGDLLYVHGSNASHAKRDIRDGIDVCVEVSLLDGLVLARSAFEHGVSYRSVVIHGKARALEYAEEKLVALEAFMEKLMPGRWAVSRPPSRQELKGTMVLAIALDSASAKISDHDPEDDPEDLERDCWAGVLPRNVSWGPARPAPDLRFPQPVPETVANYSRQGS